MLFALFALPLASALIGTGKPKPLNGKTIKVALKAGEGGCAPEAGILKLESPGTILLEGDALPKFYLHQDFVGQNATESLLNCFYKHKGATPGVDEFDYKLMPDTAEHMVDIWLIDQLKKHPKRTFRPEEAKLHVVGFPIFNSYAGARFWRCGSHEDRISQLVTKMTENKFYKKSQGKNFLIIATAPDAKRVFTEPLIEVATKGNVIVATADKNYPSVEPFKLKVVIPYKSMHPLENAAMEKDSTVPMAAQRNVSFMFHGDVEKGKRGVLKVIAKDLPESDIQNHDFQGMGMSGFKKVVENSVDTYKRRKLCLVVEGSTPSSRRLFDSLAGGAVPIMIGYENGIKRNLPFQKTIDWSKIVYYGGNLDCVSNNYVGTQNFLKSFLQLPEKEVDERRMRGFKAFKEALSYKSPGIVDALLRELEDKL
jgi:hypothetical protein